MFSKSPERLTPQLSKVLSVLFLTLISFGCADLPDDHLSSATKSIRGLGASEFIYYSCETATAADDGSQWVYQTDEIMNLMDRIYLKVLHDDATYGPIALSKVATDTFSDGNLTVTLIQKGEDKSIEVIHKNTNLVARAENGWCSTDNRAPADSTVLPSPSTTDEYDLFKVEVDPECSNPCSFVMSTNLNITQVVYESNGWMIGESKDTSNRFALSYTFNTFGPRSIVAIGYDRYGNQVASDMQNFTINSPAGTTPAREPESRGSETRNSQRLDVPYFYQYNNRFNPGSSCQNTSIAMVLASVGVQITPDQITSRFGKDRAQSVSGLNSVYNQLASEQGVRRLDSSSQGSLAEIKAALDQGSPVIIHGFFTSYGHVLVITGYDESGYYVNDPAGTWSQRFKGGYPNAGSEPRAGHGIFYSRSAFEAAIGTYDGYSTAPLWMHTLSSY